MYSEIRKLHLIEEVLKVNNEQTLTALEAVLKVEVKPKNDSLSKLKALSGVWSNEEAQEIEKIIIENCEQVNYDDWK